MHVEREGEMHYFVCYIEVDELGNHYSGQNSFLQLTGCKAQST